MSQSDTPDAARPGDDPSTVVDPGAAPSTVVDPGAPNLPPGRDTPTGDDPDAEYAEPGYQDKSFGQAVDADQDLVDRIAEETRIDPDDPAAADDARLDEAEQAFRERSAGRPAIERQRDEGIDPDEAYPDQA